MRNDILLYLNIGNNQISYEGSRYLAQALKVNKNLQSLNLKLNNLGDKAGKKLFQDLMQNKTLVELDVSGNQFEFEVQFEYSLKTSLKLSDFVSDSMCSLKQLNIANNDFNDKCFEHLKTGLTKNYSLSRFDVRGNRFSKTNREKERELLNQYYIYELTEAERELTEIVLKHDLQSQKIQFLRESDYLEMQRVKQIESKFYMSIGVNQILFVPGRKKVRTIEINGIRHSKRLKDGRNIQCLVCIYDNDLCSQNEQLQIIQRRILAQTNVHQIFL